MSSLDGRVALVTGAGRGIGRTIAVELARAGADVVVNYNRSAEGAEQTVAEVEGLGRRVLAVKANVADESERAALADAALEAFGFVDVLVHNAGITSRERPILETEGSLVEHLFRTNVVGPFELTRRFLPVMRERPRGDVVVISSSATTLVAPGHAPYSISKTALEVFAQTLAKEERPNGIHVNIVAPGLTDTEMGRAGVLAWFGAEDISELDPLFPFGRVGRPEDVAAAVRFLVSADAAYLTGQKILVDGGGQQAVLAERN